MKKVVGILVVLVLSMIAAVTCAEELTGIWRCAELEQDFIFVDSADLTMRLNYTLSNNLEELERETCDGGVIINGETFLLTEDGALSSIKDGRIYRKRDFNIDVPVREEAAGIHDFLGDWEIAAWRSEDWSYVFPPDYATIVSIFLHIEEKEAVLRYILRNGTDSSETVIPLSNPRIDNGELVLDARVDNQKVTVILEKYQNGWIKSPYSYGRTRKFYLARADASDPVPETSVATKETAAGQETEDQEPAGQYIMHTAKGGLEVKASASRSAKKVVTLKKDREVTVLGMEGDWYYIEVDLGNKKVQGYVPADALK